MAIVHPAWTRRAGPGEPISASVAAVVARALQHDVVLLDRIAALRLDAADCALELRVVERLDLPALGAHKVVMMLARLAERLVAGDAAADVDAPHEAHRVQRRQDAGDARDPRSGRERRAHLRCRGPAAHAVERRA